MKIIQTIRVADGNNLLDGVRAPCRVWPVVSPSQIEHNYAAFVHKAVAGGARITQQIITKDEIESVWEFVRTNPNGLKKFSPVQSYLVFFTHPRTSKFGVTYSGFLINRKNINVGTL